MPDDVLIDAANAERALNDPTFQRMLVKLEQRITDAWKSARTVEDRERQHAYLIALRELSAEFTKTIDAGVFEKARRKLHA